MLVTAPLLSSERATAPVRRSHTLRGQGGQMSIGECHVPEQRGSAEACRLARQQPWVEACGERQAESQLQHSQAIGPSTSPRCTAWLSAHAQVAAPGCKREKAPTHSTLGLSMYDTSSSLLSPIQCVLRMLSGAGPISAGRRGGGVGWAAVQQHNRQTGTQRSATDR